MSEQATVGREPKRIWWVRPRKLCALERPGGGGRSHRPERRAAEIEHLRACGVRLVISTMVTRHNLAAYEAAGLRWHHRPVGSAGAGEAALDELLTVLRRELRGRGAVAVHGNRQTDFVAALCAAHLHESTGLDPAEGLARAAAAGLVVTVEAARLIGVGVGGDQSSAGADAGTAQPRSRIAASTAAGRSVTT